MNHGQQIAGQQFGGQHLRGQQIGGPQIGAQQLGGPQIGGQIINPMFYADRAPHRHVKAYQQAPDLQPPHR